ncbi:thioredoxin-disulfide reductase [Nanoarchaeota archaeon]
MSEDKVYDVIVIGAGAAGMTSAIYTCRKELSTLIIAPEVGGQTNLTSHIENYPGFEEALAGWDLMSKFRKQAERFGAEFITGKVTKVEKIAEHDFKVSTEDGKSLKSKSIMVAAGKVPRKLGVPGEDDFYGKGVSVCVTCDAPFYKEKIAAVVGGGNSAVEGALELSNIATKVYLIHRREEFRADEISIDKIKANEKIELLTNSEVKEIKGEQFVKSIKVMNNKDNSEKEIEVDGVFTEIGYIADTSFVEGVVDLNERKEITIDSNNRTSQSGIFAAGDITNVPYKQTVISAGEGAKAALECYKYVTGHDLGDSVSK